MKEKRIEESLKWSLILGLTVILAGVSGFMVVNRKEFFPEMYNHEPAKKSNSLKSDTTKNESDNRSH